MRTYNISVDKRMYEFLRRDGSISVAIHYALTSYLDYLEKLDPDTLLEEIIRIRKICSKNGHSVNFRPPEPLLKRLSYLQEKYRLPISGIVNRALQFYIETNYGIRFELDVIKRRERASHRERCYNVDIGQPTFDMIKQYKGKLGYIIKEYIDYFESLDAKSKLLELSRMYAITDSKPRCYKIEICNRIVDIIDNICDKYALRRKRLILRAVQWYEENKHSINL